MTNESHSHEEAEANLRITTIMFFTLLAVYIIIGTWMEIKHFCIGHETGVIILIGIAVSVTIYHFKGPHAPQLQWNNEFFFNALLPLIIFATGYNMRRKKFFENISNVAKFGLLGTVLTFILYSGFTILLVRFVPMEVYDPITGGEEPMSLDFLDPYQIAYMCSILSSSDIIAAVTLVKYEEQPKLFSVILGEGLFNDAVAVILFQAMRDVALEADRESKVTSGNFVPELMLNFFKLCSISVLIGLVFGFMAALLTKTCRFISHSAIHESSLFICAAMLAYFISEAFEMSAIVSLLATSIILSHYAFYNLSPQGQHVTSVTFQTLGYMAEAIVFAYVGVISASTLTTQRICWKLVLGLFFIVIIGRFLAVYISYFVFECACCGKKKNKLSCAQLSFIAYAALIRGAIAFGLSQMITGENFGGVGDMQKQVDVVQSTILVLIIVTTIFIGGLTPVVQRILLPKAPEDHVAVTANQRNYSVNQEALSAIKEEEEHDDRMNSLMQKASVRKDEDMTMKTHYNEFVHPNLEDEEEVVQDEDGTVRTIAKRRGCIEYFNEFDDKWLRPCCIYKYNRLKKRQNFEFADILQEYEAIQEELNNEDEDDFVGEVLGDDTTNNKTFKSFTKDQSMHLSVSMGGGRGLLAQYIRQRSQREVASSNSVSKKNTIRNSSTSMNKGNADNNGIEQFSLAGSRTMKQQSEQDKAEKSFLDVMRDKRQQQKLMTLIPEGEIENEDDSWRTTGSANPSADFKK